MTDAVTSIEEVKKKRAPRSMKVVVPGDLETAIREAAKSAGMTIEEVKEMTLAGIFEGVDPAKAVISAQEAKVEALRKKLTGE